MWHATTTRQRAIHSTKRDSSLSIRAEETNEPASKRLEPAINHHPADTSSTHRRQHEQRDKLSIFSRFKILYTSHSRVKKVHDTTPQLRSREITRKTTQTKKPRHTKAHLVNRVHDRPQQEQPRRPFASTRPSPGYVRGTNGTGEEPAPEGRLQLDQRSYRNPLKPR
jgi:hypothetical protein